MLQLNNGCSCSTPTISPKEWNSKGASLDKDWYIQYRFHDPKFKTRYPNGKFCIVKSGVNYFKTLAERRVAISSMLKNEIRLLVEEGYNPCTNTKDAPLQTNYEIEPTMPFNLALQAAADKMQFVPETLPDLKSCLKYIFEASIQLRYNEIEIQHIKRRHVKFILEHLAKIRENWSAHTHNKYRAYLVMLFKYLLEVEAVESNPVRDVSKQKTVRKIRLTLTLEERKKVNTHLKVKNYPFFRFMQIFFHSGGRIKELLSLRATDVDLEKQTYKTIVNKGKEAEEKKRTIKNIALPFWEQIMALVKNDDDFIFSDGLVPGAKLKPIRREQITRRWNVHVKEELNLKPDFYSLKHLNLDETTELLNEESAAAQAGHTSTAMVREVYGVGIARRQHEALKKLGNSFEG